ncbi:nucleoside phosphorylase [Lactobacillus johnsonii]|uniref:Uridine phosphorylase n=1 Tax=Lactobacillus johnsonii N6.2 TaxID=1408186 RepID=A0A7D9N6G4_LACJH|nr:nucleoside phosphorylase [Lactobacillus johnsonii]AHA97338.1 phosphorylase [Lactobacillus johnsonii N6.2]
MKEERCILQIDKDTKAVIEPDYEKQPFKFHSKLLFAFVPKEDIDNFLEQVSHKVLGSYDTISFQPDIYEIERNGEYFTLCQAPLGAPAATQLLDWLIAYGVKKDLAFGNAGALVDLRENEMFIPTKAIRDEGTSFHYLEDSLTVDLNTKFLSQVKKAITELDYKYNEVTTWTTDAFFRETPKKVKQLRDLGASVVEMECSALAACAQFRKIKFAQILFTADTLAKEEDYDPRDGGTDSHRRGLEICFEILQKL